MTIPHLIIEQLFGMCDYALYIIDLFSFSSEVMF